MQDRSATSQSRLVIVGGGNSGWMTAALLSRQVTQKECHITVIAEDDTGIGVGEATITSILRLLRTLGADEAEFMRTCDATWKLGIQFSDWMKPGHDYWHPFGICGARIAPPVWHSRVAFPCGIVCWEPGRLVNDKSS